MGRKTTAERLWYGIDKLKVLLEENPNISLEECRKIIEDMERDIKALRRRELRRQKI